MAHSMTRDEHIEIHKQLHRSLDALIADWITHGGKDLAKTTIMELLQWSYQQTLSPAEEKGTNNGNEKGSANRTPL